MLLHASCVSINGKAVLLAGPPGAGKSDLALRLIDSGAQLVADDQVLLRREGNALIAAPPESIAGMIEMRHVGLIKMPYVTDVPVALYVELTAMETALERLPAADSVFLLDHAVQRLRLPAFASSTPVKIRFALIYPTVP